MESNIIEYPINTLIQKRKSIRSFTEKPIEDNVILSLFEAARWSFSSGNEQPWNFFYGKNKDDIWQGLYNSLMDGNKSWCIHAPLLILVLAKKQTSKGSNYKHNLHDTGAATMLLALQAADMGLQAHPMGGFMLDKLTQFFNIPEHLEAVTILAVGYPNHDYSSLTEKQIAGETTRGKRHTQQEFVLNNSTPTLLK